MQALGLNEIREKYLVFFEKKGHLRLPSFSLVPQNDPSILLINAGMTPMKPYFTGQEIPPSKRVTTCQKCIRTPDIDRVGLTSRHGTFFEMLGNFSFGDYFKEEIIPWSWEFLTEELQIPEERLSVSVYFEDDEAYDIWHNKVGLPENKIFRMGKEDNFWEHGVGPCGPCSEIYYDRGVQYSCGKEDCSPGCDCDRFVEIWNLVFSQFDRQEDGSYLPLKQKNIDTGGGLERFACMMQGVDNLFEVDTVRSTLNKVCEISSKTYKQNEKDDIAIRVVTDHIRSTVMMIGDGITPSNTGRGYVLRRLLRRASRYGRLLGIKGLFLSELAEDVIANYKNAYPELEENRDFILTVIVKEEERFDRTVNQGMSMLEKEIENTLASNKSYLPSETVFLLHDTYGFPLDLTREIAKESGLDINEDDFYALMKVQRSRAREALLAKGESAWATLSLPSEIKDIERTNFVGYNNLEADCSLKYILAYDDENKEFSILHEASSDEHKELILIFDKTPFYAEGGGQIADQGYIDIGNGLSASVVNVSKPDDKIFLHRIILDEGEIRVGEIYHLVVDKDRRKKIAINHSCTHLLHYALRTELGTHVKQAGSYVGPDRLRFDFSHYEAISPEQLKNIENKVNSLILDNEKVITEVMSMSEAKETGAMALFNEKYGDNVRVVTMGPSKELCGGTHLSNTSEACYFRIVSEQSAAAGVRRIEAVTASMAFEMATKEKELLAQVATELKTQDSDILQKINRMREDIKSAERKIEKFNSIMAEEELKTIQDSIVKIASYSYVSAEVKSDTVDNLRDMADRVRDKYSPISILLVSTINDKLSFVSMVSKEIIENKSLYAGDIVKKAATAAGGGGGGRKDMAQAGAKDVSKISLAIKEAEEYMRDKLSD